MIKKIILFAVLVLGTKAVAQDQGFKIPDYKAIEKEIQDKKSTFYYPQLI